MVRSQIRSKACIERFGVNWKRPGPLTRRILPRLLDPLLTQTGTTTAVLAPMMPFWGREVTVFNRHVVKAAELLRRCYWSCFEGVTASAGNLRDSKDPFVLRRSVAGAIPLLQAYEDALEQVYEDALELSYTFRWLSSEGSLCGGEPWSQPSILSSCEVVNISWSTNDLRISKSARIFVREDFFCVCETLDSMMGSLIGVVTISVWSCKG